MNVTVNEIEIENVIEIEIVTEIEIEIEIVTEIEIEIGIGIGIEGIIESLIEGPIVKTDILGKCKFQFQFLLIWKSNLSCLVLKSKSTNFIFMSQIS